MVNPSITVKNSGSLHTEHEFRTPVDCRCLIGGLWGRDNGMSYGKAL